MTDIQVPLFEEYWQKLTRTMPPQVKAAVELPTVKALLFDTWVAGIMSGVVSCTKDVVAMTQGKHPETHPDLAMYVLMQQENGGKPLN